MSEQMNANDKSETFREVILKEDVERMLKNLPGSYKLIRFDVKAYSSERMGFMGAHHSLVVSVQDRLEPISESRSLRFFVKTIPHDSSMQLSLIRHSRAFHRETKFYRLIVPELLASIDAKSWIAEHYLVKPDALIFEDLKSRDFAARSKILDLAQLKSALASLAKLHASSMLAEKRLGERFGETHPEILREGLFVRTGQSYAWFSSSVDVAVAVATRKLGLSGDRVARICDALSSDESDERRVVCHGDCWANNLMFDDDDSECVMVDYQVVRYLCGAFDVALLVYLTTLRSFREAFELELVEFYHGVLSDTLRRNDAEIPAPSFDQILQDYESMRVVGLTTAALCLPLHLLDVEACADLTGRADGFARMLFEDHVELVLDLMGRDEMYDLRISEIVAEMVEKAEQLLKK